MKREVWIREGDGMKEIRVVPDRPMPDAIIAEADRARFDFGDFYLEVVVLKHAPYATLKIRSSGVTGLFIIPEADNAIRIGFQH